MGKKQVASSSAKSAQRAESRERASIKGNGKAHVAIASEQAAVVGMTTMADGLADLTAAAELTDMTRIMTASGAVDVTRGTDLRESAAEMSALGDIAASQGKLDLAQGVEMLRASDDIAALGRATRSLSEDQLARGLKLAGIAGQLDAVGAAVRALGMPVDRPLHAGHKPRSARDRCV